MDSALYHQTERFVIKILGNNPNDLFHAQRTAEWIKRLKPEADVALLISGLAHDIERAVYGDWKAGSDDPDKLQKHQELSAKEIEKFLRQEQADEEIIERVKDLVLHHEQGGTKDQNILCDADCLAYFEEKALRNAKKYKQAGKTEEFKKKLEYVFSRIHSSKAKQIAQKWYAEAIDELNWRSILLNNK